MTRAAFLIAVALFLLGCKTCPAPAEGCSRSGLDSPTQGSLSHTPPITNLLSGCIDTEAEIGTAPSGSMMVNLTFTAKKSIAACGCTSALVRYRVFRTTVNGETQFLTEEFNSLAMTGESKKISHQLPADGAPYRVQVSCGESR